RGGCRGIGRSGEIGVAGHPTKAGEVLQGDRDTRLPHATQEGGAMAAGGSWIMAVLALQDPDRLVLGIGPRRDHVHYGSEVQVDAGRMKLLPPYGGPALEHPRRPRPLDDSGWYPGKPGPLHGLDQASFQAVRVEKPNVGGGGAR